MPDTSATLPDLPRDASVFARAATTFFNELAKHNTREFFTTNRDR